MGKTYGKHPAPFCHKSSLSGVDHNRIATDIVKYFHGGFHVQSQSEPSRVIIVHDLNIVLEKEV